MRRTPLANLESRSADGVPAAEVYAVLDTPEGVDRAFRKLDTIKDQVVWWDAGAQPPQMLADGEVVMTTAYNGRIFNAQVLESQPFTIVWHGQVLEVSNLAIVSGSGNLNAARRLISYASRPASMAAVSCYIAYSPSRRSAEKLVSSHLAGRRHGWPHAHRTREHPACAVQRLVVVGRQRRGHERAVRILAVALIGARGRI